MMSALWGYLLACLGIGVLIGGGGTAAVYILIGAWRGETWRITLNLGLLAVYLLVAGALFGSAFLVGVMP